MGLLHQVGGILNLGEVKGNMNTHNNTFCLSHHLTMCAERIMVCRSGPSVVLVLTGVHGMSFWSTTTSDCGTVKTLTYEPPTNHVFGDDSRAVECEKSKKSRAENLTLISVEDQWERCEFPYSHHLGLVGEDKWCR